MAENGLREQGRRLDDQTGQSALPVFDFEVALVRLGGSVELLQQLVILYSEDAPELLQELREGAARGDLERLKRAAHTLKGLAANFEATPAAQAALRVEQLAQANDLAAAVQQLPAMELEFDKLQRALDRQIASPS